MNEPLSPRIVSPTTSPAAPLPAPLAAPPAAGRPGRAALGLLALGLGAGSEALLFQPPTQAGGAVGLVGAMTAAALAARGLPARSLFSAALPARNRQQPIPRPRRLGWRLAGIGTALLLAGSSILVALRDPAAVFGGQGVLWLASMSLLVVASARWYPPATGADDPAWTRQEMLLFAGLVGLALLTRVTALQDLPWQFHADETVAQAEALRFYNGPTISLFTTTWYGTGLPSGWFAVPAGLMRLFGTELAASRLGVALVGALTVIPVYGLARLTWGRTAAVCAAFALAVSAAAVHYSRISIDNAVTPFCWTICFYFLLRGLRSRRPGDFVWAGLVAGLSMYTYYGTRLLPYLLLIFAGYLALCHRRAFRERIGLLALVLIGFVVGFGPLLAAFWRQPELWAGRGLDQLTVPPGLPTTWAALATDWNRLAPLLVQNFLGVSVIPPQDGCYEAPLLLPAEAVLLWLGVGLVLARWRQPGAFLLLLWGLGVVFVGGTLVGQGYAPLFTHWTPAFPVFYLVLALPPAFVLQMLAERETRWQWAGGVALAAGMLALALGNGYTYLIRYPPTVPPAFVAAQGRYLATLGSQDRVRFVGNSWESYFGGVTPLLAPRVPASDFLNPSRALPLPAGGTQNLVFIFNIDEQQYAPLIQHYYPGGVTAPLLTPGGPVGSTYRVPAGQATAGYGVLLTLGEGPAIWTGRVPVVGALPNPGDIPASPPYPLTATWSGALFVPAPGPLQLRLEGVQAGRFWVEDQPVGPAPVLVDAGWVPFSVQARLSGPVPLQLLAGSGDRPLAPVDGTVLWPQALESGLLVTITGRPPTRRIDPFVGSGVLNSRRGPGLHPALPAPGARDPELVPLAAADSGVRLRWVGEVWAEGGRYQMNLRTDARARLWIDGRLVVDLCANRPPPAGLPPFGGDPGQAGEITLAAGWHPVQIDLDTTGIANGLEWAWTRPDGVFEIVPPQRLRHRAPGRAEGTMAWPAPPGPVACAP